MAEQTSASAVRLEEIKFRAAAATYRTTNLSGHPTIYVRREDHEWLIREVIALRQRIAELEAQSSPLENQEGE